MRTAALALLVPTLVAAVVGCSKGKSKLDFDRGGDVDPLWDLAPDGTELGIVASKRAVGLAFRGLAALRGLVQEPDLAPVKPQLDALLKGMFGSETATPEDAGFATDRPFAMFVTSGGVIGVMPVGNRDKFMAAKHGKRGSAEDVLETNTCRQIGTNYVCATQVDMFERIGKGKLRGKLAVVGTRGDAELYMSSVALLGQNKGDLAIAVQLEPGQLSVTGRWLGEPDGPLQALAGMTAPKPNTAGASGFVALDATPFLKNVPALPITGDVTFEQLAKSLAGPVTATIPAGSVDIQISAPLTDPKPLQTVIANCKDVEKFFELAKTQTPGACRIVLQGTNALELDTWVEGNTLRLGAHKGAMPAGKPGGMTAFGRELANGTWSAAFWGRGTMLNLSGITAAQQEIPPEVALGIHAMALVNELGAAVRVDKDGMRFRGVLRTAWTNPPAVTEKIIKVSGNDVVSGKATAPALAIVKQAPGSPFAADFDAGQGGLMVPAAMIGLASAVVIPAVMRMMGISGDEAPTDSPTGAPPMDQADLVSLLIHAYAEEAYPKWKADHPKQKCPATLAEVAKYFGDNPGLPVEQDPWGNALVMKCDDKGFSVSSLGPDGKPGTEDDVHL
ncbi:MAG TPA: hypothetical protein VIV40_33725 [Kofleriaceae bacterium]